MLNGIFPVLPTPFRADGAIDPDSMKQVVDFVLGCGVDGVVFPGFASEVDELRAEERVTLLRLVVERVGGRVPIVAGASAPTAEAATAHATEALSFGIRTVMIQAPKSVGVGVGPVAAFYRQIAEALPDVEIVLQNAPAPRGSDLAPTTILEIVRGLPAITYVKEETLPSGGPIAAMLADKPAHLQGVMGGGGARTILDEYRRGACGAMPAAELADVHVAVDRAFRSGDEARARDLYMRSLPLLLIQSFFRMRFTKYVLMRRGIIGDSATRAKGPPLDATDRAEIDAWLAIALEGFETRR